MISGSNVAILAVSNIVLAVLQGVFIKYWSITDRVVYLVVSIVVGVGAALTFAFIARSFGLAVSISALLPLSLLFNVLVGVVFFKESITVIQGFGMALAVAAVYLILAFGK